MIELLFLVVEVVQVSGLLRTLLEVLAVVLMEEMDIELLIMQQTQED
jgi:hypothetical protein